MRIGHSKLKWISFHRNETCPAEPSVNRLRRSLCQFFLKNTTPKFYNEKQHKCLNRKNLAALNACTSILFYAYLYM